MPFICRGSGLAVNREVTSWLVCVTASGTVGMTCMFELGVSARDEVKF